MKLVIIGGKGQVGQEFKKHVSSENLVLLGHEDIEIADYASVMSCLENHEMDAIINLAAFHNTDLCEVDRSKAFLVNAIGAHNVARVAFELKRKVVFFSTDYVFGLDSQRDEPYIESDPVAPLNVYGSSKVAGELLVRASNENHLIIRTSSLYGVVTSKKGWTFPEMIYRKARNAEPLKVVTDKIMSPTYANEMVRATLDFLENDAVGTVHIAGGGQCSWYEFACATLTLLHINVAIEPVSSDAFRTKAQRPAYSVLDSMLFEKYHVKPMKHWQDALEQYLLEKGEM
jgi:dTDP-4-dehydrorhamnose reductase